MRKIFLSFLFFVFLLLLFSMIIGFSKNFYLMEFSKYHPERDLKVEARFVRYAGQIIPEYLMGKRDNLNIPGFKNFFNEKEIKHMEDVKRIFFWVKIFSLSSIILFLIFLKPEDLPIVYFYSLIFLILLATLFLFFPFDKLFTIFHEILFTNKLWLLNPEKDRLIVLLPEKFFIDAVVWIVSLSVSSLVILTGLYKFIIKRGKV